MVRRSALSSVLLAALIVTASGTYASAGERWDEIHAEAFGARTIHDGRGIVALTAPYRPDDVRSVPLSAEIALKDGRTVRAVSFIVDENPAPVAAVFRLGEARSEIRLATHIRLDQQSDVRVVVEASDGALYMVEQFVKFAGGQASCSAPPMGDPDEIAANMGKMNLTPVGAQPTGSRQAARARFELNHPNHTGMVLDQITLHYTPLRMVSRIEVRQGDVLMFEMTGSITLAQNPVVEFDYTTGSAAELVITAEDTDGAAWTQLFPIGPAG
ncbi:sulfur oxidation protein SoxZ [Hyphomicrobium nitrativorans NL23]|uniref:Sulfur oxidation protein SoxZ n=1 Tax=Hyphomicrobium nitrativorans NL23 TaxID=1029756 RepID=V5SI82_9HYPH|nr:quinoprotein dehydrogenase-associated SoxYZ-like carrier [Hyphomicrobium nitrativorans]AHB49755.1 sulfur oxidation protein SoxZ [Hyphomicrobium nitrativorans NL23]